MCQLLHMWITSFIPSIQGNKNHYPKFYKWEIGGSPSIKNLLQATELGRVGAPPRPGLGAFMAHCAHPCAVWGGRKREGRQAGAKGGFFPLNFKTLDKKPALGAKSSAAQHWCQEDVTVNGAGRGWRGWAGQRHDWKEAKDQKQQGIQRLFGRKKLKRTWENSYCHCSWWWREPVSKMPYPEISVLPQIITKYAGMSLFGCLLRMFVCFKLHL